MFIEGNFSWDKEGERTSLEWPPLMSPDVAEESTRAEPKEEIVRGMGPDVTAADLHARDVDNLSSAAFPAEDWMSLTSRVVPENEGQAASIERDGTDYFLDEEYESEDEGERPPRRRLSTRKGSLIIFGTAVTVALSGGYAAQAFGWRLPPTLRESAQPMREFLWSLAPSRLVGLMAAEDRPARPLTPGHHGGTGLTSDRAQPIPPAAESLAASTAAPSETEESVAAVPPSRVVDPGDGQALVDPVATRSAIASPPGTRWGADSSGTAGIVATRAAPLPANRDRLARAWHGFVWSPAAQRLVPAGSAIDDHSAGALLPAAAAAVPVR